jgi:hypothetical protein
MRPRLIKPLVLLPAALISAGCATLFSPGPTPVRFESDAPGAEVYVDGTMRGKTPLTLRLDNKKSVAVTFRMAGRPEQTVQLRTKVRPAFVVLDVIGGLIPVVVDAATGEWKRLDPTTVNVTMPVTARAEP